jgi:hypothetical protein
MRGQAPRHEHLPMISATTTLLAATLALDGEAALRHASALSALGPHPFGSPRSRFAAEYVAAQLRQAGLSEVRLQEVEGGDTRGANVLGVLRGPGSDFLVFAAHHDTAQDSPGAYGSGGGVGVLIEAARVLARRPERSRTLVFASFDAREPVLSGRGSLGARAYIQSLGREGRQLVGALVLDRAGGKGQPTVIESVPYPDPLRPGGVLVPPAFLVRAVVDGARTAGEALPAGDPTLSWLYQAGVRTFRVEKGGDERPFLEAGQAALRLSARRLLAADGRDLTPTDLPEHLDARVLSQTGRVLLGATAVLEHAGRPAGTDGDWFLQFGKVIGRNTLLVVGALSLLPALLLAGRGGLGFRIVHAGLFLVLLYRHPVVALFAFGLWNLLRAFPGRRGRLLLMGALPALALFASGLLAWSRGAVVGVHLALWEQVLAILVALLALVPAASGRFGKLRARRSLPRRFGSRDRAL